MSILFAVQEDDAGLRRQAPVDQRARVGELQLRRRGAAGDEAACQRLSLSVPASSINGSYTVSWGSVATATSYKLLISSNGGSTWSAAYSGSAMSWGASGQGSGSYMYQVEACNAGGCSPLSATATTTVLLPPASAPSLSVPASSATGSYTVSWGSVATASSYILQESANGGVWGNVQSGSATSWSTSGRGDGSYSYRVQASNTSGYGPWSGTGTTTVLLPPVLPTRPLTLSVSGTTSKPTVHASWAAVATAASYQLQMSEGGTTWDPVYTGTGTTWSELIFYSGSVEFQLKACNNAGCSGWSAIQSVTLHSGGGAAALPLQTPTQRGTATNQATAGEGTP